MRTSRISFILAVLFCLISVGDLHAQFEGDWGVFSTRFSTIFFEKEVDLKSVNRFINLSFPNFYGPSRTFRKSADLSIEEVLSKKFDAIFNRVQETLDMYPSNIHVAINIYKERHELDAAYEEIFNEPNQSVSFYVYKTNTIYTTEDAINERLLAHEMAHCIIDHYFVILPPIKIQEILAAYADVHLKD